MSLSTTLLLGDGSWRRLDSVVWSIWCGRSLLKKLERSLTFSANCETGTENSSMDLIDKVGDGSSCSSMARGISNVPLLVSSSREWRSLLCSEFVDMVGIRERGHHFFFPDTLSLHVCAWTCSHAHQRLYTNCAAFPKCHDHPHSDFVGPEGTISYESSPEQPNACLRLIKVIYLVRIELRTCAVVARPLNYILAG
jgi:hypothetical protein